MTDIIGDCSPSTKRTALKKHKRKYALCEIFNADMLDVLNDVKVLEVAAQIGKTIYLIRALKQEELDIAEEKSGWAVGIPTSYAICKSSARLTLFPAPDEDGYTLLVTARADLSS
jgi:hypothetical protein